MLIGGLLLDCDPGPNPNICAELGKNDRPPKYLEGILRNGGGNYFDGVAFHAYDFFPYYAPALGDYSNARAATERALAIFDKSKLCGPDHVYTGIVAMNLAELLTLLGDYEGAVPFAERGLAILEKSDTHILSVDPYLAGALQVRGELLWKSGDHAGAKPLLVRALKIREKSLGPDHPDVGEPDLGRLRTDPEVLSRPHAAAAASAGEPPSVALGRKHR